MPKKRLKERAGHPVRCECGNLLGRFDAEDDHSGVYMQCGHCWGWAYVSNQQLCEAKGDIRATTTYER